MYEQLRYARYLSEPCVRTIHDQMLALLAADPAFRRVIDLGCGKSNEFFYHANPTFYVGVDLNPLCLTWELDPRENPNGIKGFNLSGNYRSMQDQIKEAVEKFGLTAVVSLFSVENTAPPEANEAFYQELFEQTTIAAILTAGFYYRGNEGEPIVEEDGVLAYQSPPALPEANPTFSEVRSLVACPSKMFGEKPIEVWRLFKRK